MVKGWVSGLTAAGIATAVGAGAVPTIDIAGAQAVWPPQFVVSGTKTEPTYIEHIRLRRDNDLFTLEGGAAAGMEPSRESVALRPNGSLVHRDCPAAMHCDDTAPPSGFLASAIVLAAIRNQQITGRLPLFPYGDFQLVCIPAERLGIREPVLDPCFDAQSGAVMAQRHRRSGEFDGPSLDPWSISFSSSAVQFTSSSSSSPM
jgi:hypothetical protein